MKRDDDVNIDVNITSGHYIHAYFFRVFRVFGFLGFRVEGLTSYDVLSKYLKYLSYLRSYPRS